MVTEEHKPVCQICQRSIPAKDGNTINLMAHLKEHHPELLTQAILSQNSSKDGISGMKKSVQVTKPAKAVGKN